MNRLFITAVLAVLVSFGFSSCRKCVVCTRSASPEVRVCQGDYSTNTDYGLAVDSYETSGYDCN